ALSDEQALVVAGRIGFPVLVRPSYVLGGRGMEIVYDREGLVDYLARAGAESGGAYANGPLLIDRFLDDAIEIDVDALHDGSELYVGGIMEHIEEAGIHSGDSACSLPPATLGDAVLEQIRTSTEAIARGVGVQGLINIQYALSADTLYVIEANPRASRTVPFVSKATNTQLAKAATLIMLGSSIAELRATGMLRPTGDGAARWRGMPIAVKEAVMPFSRFLTKQGRSVDTLLGPEMRSTGEVMGIDRTFGVAFAKAQEAVYGSLPTSGAVFVSAANRDKRHIILPLKELSEMGFRVLATEGTASVLMMHDIDVTPVRKYTQGRGPHGEPTIVDLIEADEVSLIFNTPTGETRGGRPRGDGYEIRTAAILHGVPSITTVQALESAVQAIQAVRGGGISVRPLQKWGADMDEHFARRG
ncbi:MAG: carbamoyl phosphate synthase large subunit, partial [Propionibacterium acidifaciens]